MEYIHTEISAFLDSREYRVILNPIIFKNFEKGRNKLVEIINKHVDLEVYIINLHPSKITIDSIPHDYDGIKDRVNDIVYSDRNSHYTLRWLQIW